MGLRIATTVSVRQESSADDRHLLDPLLLAAGVLTLIIGAACWIGGLMDVTASCTSLMGPQLCSTSTTPLGRLIATIGLTLVAGGATLLAIWGARRALRAPLPLI